jgi:glycerol-3-phosphate dehydrogenase (NAD(P)+)
MKNIYFIGAGAIATALGNVLAKKEATEVTLITIEDDVAKTINGEGINKRYFPAIPLERKLKATTDHSLLGREAVVFIAIPSVATVKFIREQQIHPGSLLVNLAKGFGDERRTIVECLQEIVPNPVCTLKGPSFAREIINNQPTAFTLGTSQIQISDTFSNLFQGTSIYLDYSNDVRGVELISILKNIYAIVIGIVDAQFESPNLKFLVFTKAINELKKLLIVFGGREEILFNYCGIGDFALTALNDLSRNRTLGLLIGKGFFTDYISEKVVLEGRIAVNIFYNELQNMGIEAGNFPIMNELYKVFRNNYDISGFVGKIVA